MAGAAGPFPFPSVPWQAAQYWTNISLPDAALVRLIGVFLISVLLAAGCWAKHRPAAMTMEPKASAVFLNMKFLLTVGIDPR
jgi:uncharacterized membrane protein